MQIDNDPNYGRNRIPSLKEVQTLRTLHSQNLQLSDNLKAQLSVTREAHHKIQARHNKLLEELESVQSELNASQRFIALLERQESMLHEDIERISGLIHPIRRCPEDVLRMIFELAVEERSYERFQKALQLSHVCKSWRSITLQTRSLWSSLNISYQCNPYNVRGMLSLAVKFGAWKPFDLTIRNAGASEGFEPVMTVQEIIQYIEDSNIVSLTTLNIQLLRRALFTEIWQRTYRPSIHIGEICISSGDGPQDDTPCNYWTVLRPFPRLEELKLDGMGEVTIEGFSSHSLLRHLHIEDATMRTFPFQMAILHVLEELRLYYTIIPPNSWRDVLEIPTLHRLSVLETEGFMWDKLSTPLLQTLVMDEERTMAADFICRHPSIQQLDAPIMEEHIQRIGDALTELTALDLQDYQVALLLESIATLPSSSFPKLEDLKFHLPNHADLSMESFEKVVLRLCALPQATNSISPAPRSVIYLRITGERDRMEDPPASWRRSDLMKYFHQSVEYHPGEGAEVTLCLE